LSAVALTVSVVAAHAAAAPTSIKSPEDLARIVRRRWEPESNHDTQERQQQPQPLRDIEMIAWREPARSNDDKEGREIEK